MQLGNFVPPEMTAGDRLEARSMENKPMVVVVTKRREGIKTKFNQDPKDKSYSPEGEPGLFLDLVDLTTGQVYVDVMWMNGTIVDQLSAYVGQPLPVKLVKTASQSGGLPYLAPQMLTDNELAYAQQWATANSTAFDDARAKKQAQAAQAQQQPTMATPAMGQQGGPMPPQFNPNALNGAMGAAAQSTALPPAVDPWANASQLPAAAAPVAAPTLQSVPAAGGANTPQGITPEMMALLQQIQSGQVPGTPPL
jgi:hypothetical protein